MNIFTVLPLFYAGIITLMLGEFLYSVIRNDGLYSIEGTFGNVLRSIVTRLIQRLLDSVTLAYTIFLAIGISEPDQSLSLSSVFLSLLLIDGMYYIVHRTHHRIPFLWVFHSVHHSDNKYNLSTGLRVAWFQELYFAAILTLPAFVVGYSLKEVAAALFFFSAYQALVHTAYVSFPRFFDAILVTPRNHRIHHDQVESHQRCNFSGVFSLWDRLFGTYIPAIETFTPGIKGYHQDDFIKMETDPIKEYFIKNIRP